MERLIRRLPTHQAATEMSLATTEPSPDRPHAHRIDANRSGHDGGRFGRIEQIADGHTRIEIVVDVHVESVLTQREKVVVVLKPAAESVGKVVARSFERRSRI